MPTAKPPAIPPELEPVRDKARLALGNVKPSRSGTSAPSNFLFNAKRSDAGRKLAPAYLVYFLLVDLLGFKDLGRFEKLAWSIPIDLNGTAFLVEHRKFGVGVFAANLPAQEQQAEEITQRINKAIKIAQPYFEWVASEAVSRSELNIINNHHRLFQRFSYFLKAHKTKIARAKVLEKKRVVKKRTLPHGGEIFSVPSQAVRQDAQWLALAAIDAFFSWTEHIFVLIAVLNGTCKSGKEVADLALSDWQIKYKSALDLADTNTKSFYDKLVTIRQQLRNFVAHGAFGKQGEAFQFHSTAGAVPLLLPHKRNSQIYNFGNGVDFVEDEVLNILRDFQDHLWSGARAPTKIYLDSSLPLVLTMLSTYTLAMQSTEEMESFVTYLGRQFDDAANMDW